MAASNISSLSTSDIVALGLGALTIIGVLSLLVSLDRRTRSLRDERPPQQTKLLRPPGYSLLLRIDELLDSLLIALIHAIGAGAVAGLIIRALYPFFEGLILSRFTLTQFLAQPRWYIVLSTFFLLIAAIGWAIVSISRAKRLYARIRNCRFGMRGEQAVAEELASSTLARAGYVAFHDVPGKDNKFNIDHVIIGPGGIFVLETKTRSKRKARWDQPEHEVRVEGETIRYPWCYDPNAIPQAKRNVQWVEDFIAPFAQRPIRIVPIVVVPGWSVQPDLANSRPVKVINAANVPNYVVACGQRCTLSPSCGELLRGSTRYAGHLISEFS